ncbi:MAG: hypothetical protein ACI4LA_02385 [Emergencia sp.]
MYCKNCGKFLGEGDRFCSGCGTRVEEDFVPAFRREEEEPPAVQEPEPPVRPKRSFHIEEFNWDLDGYPTARKKTEDVDFNWSSVLEEKRQSRFDESTVSSSRMREEEKPEADSPADRSLEEELFADMGSLEADSSGSEPTRISLRGKKEEKDSGNERIDRFYTYNQKNEQLQEMLDREYERLREGGCDPEPDYSGRKTDVRTPEQVLEDILQRTGAAGAVQTERQTEYLGTVLSGVPKGYTASEEEIAAQPGMERQRAAEAAAAAAAGEKNLRGGSEAGESQDGQPSGEVSGQSSVQSEAGPEISGEKACPPREEGAPEETEHKLTFDDVFGHDDDDADEEPQKKGKALKVIATILCILVIIELIIIGIQYFAPDSAAGKAINGAYGSIIGIFDGGSDGDEQEEPEGTAESGQLAELLAPYSTAANIAAVEEDTDLCFEDGKDYGFDDFGSSYTFADRPWYTDDDGQTVTYGQELIRTVVGYYSALVDQMNGKDSDVLDYIDPTSDYYGEIESLEADGDTEYGINRLAIGEIRAGNTGFYVLTSVTLTDSDSKEEKVTESIMFLEPDERVMKVITVKKI